MSRKELFNNILLIAVTTIVCILLFEKPVECTDGIKDGLTLCASTVIPSLFPFMIVAQFILKSGLSDFYGKMMKPVTTKLFRQPGEAAGVILMSLIGGFPVGAKMTAELLKENRITENQAQRLFLFCINAGPAFIIGTVGTMFLGSRKAGVILYVSTCVAALFTGILTSILADNETISGNNKKIIINQSPISAFASSTMDASKAMIAICAWIVIFNALIKCVTSFGSGNGIIAVCSILEVTSGIKLALGVLPVPALAAILSFGGISVHCQIYSYVIKSHLNFKLFYTARIICAAVSSFICTALLKFFPCDISVFSSSSEVLPTVCSVSVPAAAALILMCAILIFEVDTDKKVC